MISHYFTGSLMTLFYVFGESKKKKSKRQKYTTQNEQNYDIFEYLSLGVFILLLLGVLIYLVRRKEQMLRSEKLRSIKKALEVKEMSKKDRPCKLTQMQKDEAIIWFQKQNWILQESNNTGHIYTTPLQIVYVKRKEMVIDESKYIKDYYDAFYFEMKGSSAKIFGTIMFEKYYMTILFDKSISSSKNENGTYNYKLYDGSLKKGVFEGQWYLTNDVEIEAEREQLLRKEEILNNISDRSFSKHEKETLSKKKNKGVFKLYHT